VVSDLDMPPYDKALMDGYAVRCADLETGAATFEVIEEVPAGHTPQKAVGAGQTTRIMTGAPVPDGCDAVVMVERSRMIDAEHVRLEDQPRPEQNILRRGREMREGATVLRAGQVLRPQEFGVLAMVGKAVVAVVRPPRVAIVPTGDELVAVQKKPGPGQIRNSNGPMVLAQVARAGGVPIALSIAGDDLDKLRALVSEGLRADVLILIGGMSAGKLDLGPKVLAELGVEILVHKVQMKPGKPVLFGIKKKEPSPTLVFGLPGNPVSAWVGFELFVGPALRRLVGHRDPGPRWLQAVLSEDFRYRTDRPTYYPVRISVEGTGLCFRPVPWLGSADLAGVIQANGLALFPVGDHQHRAGHAYPVCVQDPV